MGKKCINVVKNAQKERRVEASGLTNKVAKEVRWLIETYFNCARGKVCGSNYISIINGNFG